jgi:ABC-type nitrate/sulfonate/bicarbonate transport system permease component
MFASVLILSLMAIALFAVLALAERRIVRWR